MTSRETLSVRVPFRIRKHGGRKLMVSPDGASAPARPRIDSTLVKALARAHRWKRLLEQGDYGNLTELARAEKINLSYVGRVLRLTLLAPDIVEGILDGRQPPTWQLELLLKPFSADWSEQRRALASESPSKT
ncbi:MAG: hypothetical protein TEF_03115 [Rhizobiales bacterium NRL2]|jgi:hypothetical protein|nr:MAG: hypothetical protein TEF_03115 [Rhizobiales bacterium NRL2]